MVAVPETELPDTVMLVEGNGTPTETVGGLAFREYVDRSEIYQLGVRSAGKDLSFETMHSRTGTTLKYAIPWRFDAEPAFVSIAPSGRRIAVVSMNGHVLTRDVSTLSLQLR